MKEGLIAFGITAGALGWLGVWAYVATAAMNAQDEFAAVAGMIGALIMAIGVPLAIIMAVAA